MTETGAVKVHPAFRHLRSHPIKTLQMTVEEYEHRATGARHLHMNADSDENVFLVALRTFPMDSTGVAHILEHTVLCGSERYPVRDPFFMMIRRSLNTFMNAFTSSDWTAYPFASKNRKDFDNLLSVYLDSVFFSQLDQLDFAQEGHRLEFAEPANPESPLAYRGVVYNEMKGAMSSASAQLWQALAGHLFPSTTYHYNSGGDPDHIVDLSYESLLAFYRRHYHPSNAIFATYGNIPASEHHERFEEWALSRFEHQQINLPVKDEKRFFSPMRVEQAYAVDPSEKTAEKTHIVIGWLLEHSFDLETNLEAHLLASVLLENSASPLLRALETSGLGRAPSPLCGLEDSSREMVFVCGVEGSEPDRRDKLETLVEDVLQTVAREGVPQERLEAILHQLELHQREIAGDHFPYGLQIILASLAPMVHGGDPVALLDLEPVLERLRERIQNPDYIKQLVKRLLLDNPHRVTLTLAPDAQLEQRHQQNQEAHLAQLKEALTPEESQQIVKRAQALQERQGRKDDDSILPKVGIDDVPTQIPEPQARPVSDFPATCYAQGTNGLVYQQVVTPLPALNEREQGLLPLYTACISELGCGDLDYLAMQDRLSAETGGIGAFTSVKGTIDDVQAVRGYLVMGGKALARNKEKLEKVLHDVFNSARFDEAARIRELIAQARNRREESVTGAGHILAMGAASQGVSSAANFAFRLGGLAGLKDLKNLDDTLSDASALKKLCADLADIHRKLTAQPRQFLVIGEEENLDGMVSGLKQLWGATSMQAQEDFRLGAEHRQVNQAWLTSTQVNFCARAYPTVAVDHPDAAALTVLGGFLRNGFLHRAIREQGGAYGGGAGQDSLLGAFRFFSYRDPRLGETLDDFDASLQWLKTEKHDRQAVEEAILGVIGQLDKPRSPAGEARHAFHNQLFGRNAEQRQRFRERVLKVTAEELLRVADQWLKPENASVAVVTSHSQRKQVEARGLETIEL